MSGKKRAKTAQKLNKVKRVVVSPDGQIYPREEMELVRHFNVKGKARMIWVHRKNPDIRFDKTSRDEKILDDRIVS